MADATECPCQRCTQVTPAVVETFKAGLAVMPYLFHITERIGTGPSIVHTIGLSKRYPGHPELLVAGIDPDVAQSFLGKMVHRVKEGRHWGKEALQPFPLAKEGQFARTELVGDIPDAEWDAWFALGTAVLGGRFSVVQVTSSDRDGLFWDDVGYAKRKLSSRCAPGHRNKWAPPLHVG